jgi:hypothetical protein
MSRVITSQSQRSIMNMVINNREPTDIVFFYNHSLNIYCVGNKEEWSGEMKRFKKLRKEGVMKLLEANNQTKMIGGKKLYILVVQKTDEDQNPTIDPMGLAIDDGAFLVSGWIYAFKSKANRDASYKYIMGIKS